MADQNRDNAHDICLGVSCCNLRVISTECQDVLESPVSCLSVIRSQPLIPTYYTLSHVSAHVVNRLLRKQKTKTKKRKCISKDFNGKKSFFKTVTLQISNFSLVS